MDKNRSQNETIQKLCMSRKQQHFEFLKEWDTGRAHRLMIHRKLIDELDESIHNKLGESSAYIDVVRQFLTDLLTQKIKYELQVVNNPASKIKNNLAGKIIHRNSGKELGRLHQLTSNYKGYKKLKVILQRGLQKVQTLLVESQKQIMQTKTKIQLTINQIQNSNEVTLELCNSIMSIYKEQKNLKPHQCERDMYRQEQQFVYQAYVQTAVQKQLGIQLIKHLEYVEELEKKKLVLIKQVIGSYLEAIKQDHQDQAQLQLLQDILRKETQNKYIQECYSADELFSKGIITELSKAQLTHQQPVNLKFIKQFLSKLQYQYFGYVSYLVLKQYHIFVKLQSQLQNVTITLTVDGFLAFYLTNKALQVTNNSQEVLLQDLDYSVKIDHSLTLRRTGDINLELQSRKQQRNCGLLHNLQIICLVFNNEDQRQEFMEFVSHILN